MSWETASVLVLAVVIFMFGMITGALIWGLYDPLPPAQPAPAEPVKPAPITPLLGPGETRPGTYLYEHGGRTYLVELVEDGMVSV